jgi:DNA polymerase sigma
MLCTNSSKNTLLNESRVEFERNQATLKAMQYILKQELGQYELMPFTSLTTAYLLLHKYYKNKGL